MLQRYLIKTRPIIILKYFFVLQERKDKLIEEVRRYFGYTIDSRDERFKEMLEKKEREQKKTMKEARKKAKELKMMEKLNSAAPSGENEEIKN